MNLSPTVKESVQISGKQADLIEQRLGQAKHGELNRSGYSVSFKLFTYIYLYSPPQIETDFLCSVLFLCSLKPQDGSVFTLKEGARCFSIHNSTWESCCR